MRTFAYGKLRWILGVGAAGAVGVLLVHNVPRNPTPTDQSAIRVYTEGIVVPEGNPHSWSYIEQARVVAAVQRSVLLRNPVGSGIPLNQTREPSDLLGFSGGGLCYDRSNVLEKIYRSIGFETRHVSVYFSDEGLFSALLTPGNPSHAYSEVRTTKGWIVVDSNSPWNGAQEVLDSVTLRARWTELSSRDSLPKDFASPARMHFVYGLYSRHGKFFPPFTPVPDYNLGELLFNL